MSTWRAAGVFLIAGSLLMLSACSGNDDDDDGQVPPPPSATPRPSNTPAPATSTPLPSATPLPTDTAPPTVTPTDAPSTPTATALPDCGNDVIEPGEDCEEDGDCDGDETCNAQCLCEGPPTELGERVFTLVRPRSSFVSTAIGIDVSDNWQGQLRLVGGIPDADGIATLSLAEDVAFQFDIPLGGQTLCGKILAAGATGFIDCDGGSQADFEVTVDSNGVDAADPPVIVGPTGEPGPPGTAILVVMAAFVNLDGAGATVDDCAAAPFAEPVPTTFTTGMMRGAIVNARQGNDVTVSGLGEGLDCAAFGTTDGPGALATALVNEDAPIVNLDVANILKLADN